MLQSTTPDKRGTTQLGLHVLTDRSTGSSSALCNPNQILLTCIIPGGGGEGTRTLEPPDCQSVTVPSGWWYSVPVSPCQSAFPLKSNAAWLCPVRLNVASMAINLATFSDIASDITKAPCRNRGLEPGRRSCRASAPATGGFIGIGRGLHQIQGRRPQCTWSPALLFGPDGDAELR